MSRHRIINLAYTRETGNVKADKKGYYRNQEPLFHWPYYGGEDTLVVV
jgi:hypothetical protein